MKEKLSAFIISNPAIFASLVISAVGVMSALFAGYNSYKSRKISENIDNRTKPSLSLKIFDSYYKLYDSSRDYLFILLVSNLSDEPNSICSIKMNLYYFNDSGDYKVATIKGKSLVGTSHDNSLPISISSRNTKKIKLEFKVPNIFRIDKKIDCYEIVITDTFDNCFSKKERLIHGKEIR